MKHNGDRYSRRFLQRFPKSFVHEHTKDAIRKRLAEGPRKSYLKDFVYGAIDGTITTFAVVSGVAGAELSTSIILILGAANLLADGFSMAAGNFVSTRTSNSERELAEKYELQQIEENPEGEIEEVRQLFSAKGFTGQTLEKAVEVTVSDRQRWLAIMLREEYGFSVRQDSPVQSASATFIAFVVAGALPLLPFLFHVDNPFLASVVLTGIAFFLIGSLKSIWTIESFLTSGLKTFAIGALAASVAYGVGSLLKTLQ